MRHKSIDNKVVFVDFFDTIVYRKVHPLYVFKLWANELKTELGLLTKIDDLYKIRRDTMGYICSKRRCNNCEVSYKTFAEELYKRLLIFGSLKETSLELFTMISELADLKAEENVQYLNESMVQRLKRYKDSGIKVYLVSDTYLSETTIKQLLRYHKIHDLFEGVYVSSGLQASKQSGTIFDLIIAEQGIDKQSILMIGDHKVSGYLKPKPLGINSEHIPNNWAHFKANKFLFSDEIAETNKILRKMDHQSKNATQPYGEYGLLLYTFIKGLYEKLKQNKVRNVFFLSREGLFLKKVFDEYQQSHHLCDERRITTHYLRVSRRASLMISLKEADEEDFTILRSYPKMTGADFLDSLTFPKETINAIAQSVGYPLDEVNEDLFESELFKVLIKDPIFRKKYTDIRKTQKKAFDAYITSFGVDFGAEGLHVVDVGWGGTMQENLFKYFDEKGKSDINVEGYYLGLKLVYNITERTKRYGILFSVYPFRTSYDLVLQANGQIYEQVLAAGHGFAKAYDLEVEGLVVEETQEDELYVYSHYIEPLQTYYYKLFKELDDRLSSQVVLLETLKEYSFGVSLRMGLLLSSKNLKFLHKITEGFNQNVGGGALGITYDYKKLGFGVKEIIRYIVLQPESLFRYVVKYKQIVKGKNVIMSGLIASFYYYMKLHRLIRKQLFRRLP